MPAEGGSQHPHPPPPKSPSCNYDHFRIALFLIKLNLLPQNGHHQKCLGKSLIVYGPYADPIIDKIVKIVSVLGDSSSAFLAAERLFSEQLFLVTASIMLHEIGFFRLSIPSSFHLSCCFFGIVSLVFSKFCHGTRNPYEVVRDSWIFHNFFFFLNPKIGKTDKKCFEFIVNFCH